MRAHSRTAHGFTLDDYVAQKHYARFINDASATSSTYLLHRLKQNLIRQYYRTPTRQRIEALYIKDDDLKIDKQIDVSPECFKKFTRFCSSKSV